MNILVCVKRVPALAAKITLTPDSREIETRHLSFTISPHEECGVEEAVRLVAANGGHSTVMTLGPEDAIEQLRDALAIGIDNAILLETNGQEWDAMSTADAIVDLVRSKKSAQDFDLLIFGNEAADTGDYQVGVRVADKLRLPCVSGVKALEILGRRVIAKREFGGCWEIFEFDLPAVVSVKEGLNVPRYPSVPGRLKARKASIERLHPSKNADANFSKVRLRVPKDRGTQVEILGRGAEAVPRAIEIMRLLGVLAS